MLRKIIVEAKQEALNVKRDAQKETEKYFERAIDPCP
jgi:hypothetical protein